MIKIGPAGTGGSSLECFEEIKKNNLDGVEIEFTYSVWMKKGDALKINSLNKKLKLELSIHAPYFVNLASLEPHKVTASKVRILKCCEIGHYLGAKYIVFHAGFYQKKDPEDIFQKIKQEIISMQEIIKEHEWKVVLAPEITGKATQFGDLDELIRLKKEAGCHLCVDFSHLKARYNGVIDYNIIMNKLKGLGHLHCHFSGIEFTSKGERKHKLTKTEDIKELFYYLKKYDIDCTIINESPDPFGDALKMKKLI
jgi:deoxyribonuclease IV